MNGDELFRVVARAGGLWTLGELADVCGERIRYFHRTDDDWPRPVWKASRTFLYSGQDVLDHLEKHSRHDAAAKLKAELDRMFHLKRKAVL
jgi:hypothetical protein